MSGQCMFRALNTRPRLLTIQVHKWRCLRCTFNTGKGIAAKARCLRVCSPALFVLKKGEPGELMCCSLQMHPALHATWCSAECSTDSVCCRPMTDPYPAGPLDHPLACS